jgi:hypothetical protein
MGNLDIGYKAEVENLSKSEWHALLRGFADANFYQTWSYGERNWGAGHLGHLVLHHENRAVAMAQLRILKFPCIPKGVAYLNWGPLWNPMGDQRNYSHLRNMARALRNEYVVKRRLVLRILPKIPDNEESRSIPNLFIDEGYEQSPDPLKTYLVDLHPSIEQIRQNLHRSWKRSLNQAEKQGLTIVEARDREHYESIRALYSQMKSRKRFYGDMQMDILRAHQDLPDDLKLKIVLSLHNGEAIAALGWSSLGRSCMPLIGATGDKGLMAKASFWLWWEMIKDAKIKHADFCDTATVHEKRNQGGHIFKQGLAGKDAPEIGYIGRFDAYNSRVDFLIIRSALAAREAAIKKFRRLKIWGKRGSRSDAGQGNASMA